MQRQVTRDLTSGSPMRLLIGFSLPLMFGLLFQQFYSFVDTAIVGRYLGTASLAAVGSTGSVNFLILGFCTGICSGFGIPISQAFGARDEPLLRRYVGSAACLAGLIGVVMALLTGFLSPWMMRVMNTPADIMEEAVAYIRVIFFGIPVTVAYNLAGSVLRSVGDSRTPVFYLILASAVNIALDLVFIIVLHMGAAGAAVATVISQAAAGAGCIVSMFRHLPMLLSDRKDLRPRAVYMKKLFAMGVPMGLQYSVTAVGSIIMQAAVNGLGTAAVAAVTAASKLYCFFTCVFDALSTGLATWCGQHVGAKKLSRIPEGLRAASMIGVVYCGLVLLLVILFGRSAVGIFLDTSESAEAAAMAYRYMVHNVVFFTALLFVNLVRFSIQGMGFTRLAVLAGVFEMIARSVVALVFVPLFGFAAACLANPAAWVLADLFLFPCYVRVYRKLSGEKKSSFFPQRKLQRIG